MKQKSSTGFTLIEIMVVIAIIALLASVVLVTLAAAKQKSRDAKRLADVRQLASAMELYFNDNTSFPATLGPLTPTYIKSLPTYPSPVDTPCIANNSTYSYTGSSNTYTLLFCISTAIGSLSAGTHTLTQGGFQ